MAAFARIVGIPKSSVWAWQNEGVLPTLQHILSICRVMDVDLVDVIEGRQLVSKDWPTVTLPNQKAARPESSFDYTKAEAALEAALADKDTTPRSVRAVARSLGCNQRLLYVHFPELCKKIAARFAAYNEAVHLQRMDELRAEVRCAVWRVYEEGLYPSIRKVSLLLARPGDLRHPEARAARLEALQELDLK